jgi:hypothetical protein
MKADTSNYDANIAKASRTLDSFKKDNLSLGGVINQVTKGFTAYAAGLTSIAALGGKLSEVVGQSIELAKAGEGIRLAFDRINRSDLLDNLREATHGTVTDIELMKQAVKFNDFKLSLDEMGTMLAFAQQKAKDTGQSVDYMVDSIVTGLGRQSLMILDNLGLSAAEIKEKMKSTGDMTKAVGEIIREQMSKAGDYVETAAERATKADVELKNAMEELGRTLAPLAETGTTTFTKMETSMVKMANEVSKIVAPAVDDITSRFDVLTRKLYTQTMPVLIGISKVMEKIRGGNVAGQGADLGKSIMGAALTPGANELPEVVITGTKGGKKGKGGKTDPVYAPDSIAYQEQLVSQLTKKWKEAGDAVRNDYAAQLGYAQAKLDQMMGKGLDPSRLKEITQTASIAPVMSAKTLQGGMASLDTSPLGVLESQLKSLMEDQEKFGRQSAEVWQSYQQQIEATQQKIEQFKGTSVKGGNAVDGSWRAAASAISSVGSALQQTEDPGAKILGIVGEAIANIASGFAAASASEGKKGSVWYWIAATAAGLASMVSTIQQIHSATGYASGGVIGGTHFSGDVQYARVNAGETILNQAQAGMIANALQNGGLGGMHLETSIDAEQLRIILVRNSTRRNGRRSGYEYTRS